MRNGVAQTCTLRKKLGIHLKRNSWSLNLQLHNLAAKLRAQSAPASACSDGIARCLQRGSGPAGAGPP